MTNNLAVARATVRELADKALAVLNNDRITDAEKTRRLKDFDANLEAATSEVRNLEYVEQRRKQLFGGTDPGAINGGGIPLLGSIAQLGAAPSLVPSEDQIHELHDAVLSHKSLRIEVGVKDVSGQLPGQLAPQIVPMTHEPVRVADLIPSQAMTAPSIQYVRHYSTTGTAGMVAPGAMKPSVTLNIDKIVASAKKIAVTTTVNDEDLEDYGPFLSYVTSELQRLVIDEENTQLLTGDGTGDNVEGFFSVSGILTRAKGAAPEQGLDTIEMAATDLRTGPAYGTVTVWAMHPSTWSGLRRVKDSQGRYILGDPSSSDTSRLWDCPIVGTTSIAIGTALGLAAPVAGALHWRRGLSVQTDYGQFGFEKNQTSFRCEERLALEVAKPAAVIAVTGL